ncbi:hydroxylamine reductase [Thiospirochaeta perfilievii]|uniref:Hydroxylamine reductase n=1 Tax=Thiospirochaeta perfilievii TaxID=252967 RepID=A0A5C1QCD8_9SPIO|nr:hydroxylamine reductase [Thiospirochaeta perfilievii]QEN05211.1 hydroxylamine reductase [Thiospirochaeta perfilievii]
MGTCGKDEVLARLQDTMVFGLKGMAAYRYHADELGAHVKDIDDVTTKALYFGITNANFNFDDHISMLMEIGRAGTKCMQILGDAHHKAYGTPIPKQVTNNKAEGKCILVSGHNLTMLKKLLIATEGKGINVYTHSEMLPAHGYPELFKFTHLKGNIGGAWHDQKKLYEKWNGTIIMNTNCIQTPPKSSTYLDRFYGYSIPGVEGIKKIENDDFTKVIEQTLSLADAEGFNSDETLMTGHSFKTILTLAPQILDAVKSGKIKEFFVIAGCDAPGKDGEYFRELASRLPNTTVLLTSSCGKFRFNDIDFGVVPGTEIPRYLDLGQCNDSYGAVEIALALSDALDTPVNELPLNIQLMWMEQKAVIILLALFSLGIQNIKIGPKPAQFFNDDIINFLVEQFNISYTTNVDDDWGNHLK